nr:F-box protein SKIP2-like isoform X1 [Megalopta genalis]XP_033331795.1 F-box protein SKIP2-like isoform X1 [Megalopta genalis]XP_033331796.1 F-box protein SKIP2-like isoform X1 [Megalopta genalis]
MTYTNLLNRLNDLCHRELSTKEDAPEYRSTAETTNDGMPIKKLFVCNLAKRTTYRHLIKRFTKYGNVQNCFLMRNERKSNIAFVTFDTVESALSARDEIIQLHNKYLKVEPADSWHQPDSVPYRYYNNDGQKSDEEQSSEQYKENLDENDITKDSIQILNDDCLIHIFHQLPIVDRIRAERVCKRWRSLIQGSWNSIKKLDLLCKPYSLYHMVTSTTILRKILLRCGRYLTEINLSETKYLLRPSTLTIVAKLCPNLKNIDLTALTVCSAGIISLTNSCHNITKLSLRPATYNYLTNNVDRAPNYNYDRDLQKLFEVNKTLRYVKIVSGQISGNCLLYLPVETIEEIVLDKCMHLQEKCLSQVFEKLQNLTTLTFINCCYVNSSFNIFKTISTHCTRLKTLNFLQDEDVNFIFNDSLHTIQLPNLEALTINKYTGWYTVDVNEFLSYMVSKCRQLTFLNITGCECVTNVGIAAIATLPKLETLIMNYMYDVTDTSMHNMCNLKKLECRSCNFTDTTIIELLASAPQLELLDLTSCRKITNATLKEAAIVTVNRPDNILLKIFVGDTSVNLSNFKEVSPFLQIVNVV